MSGPPVTIRQPSTPTITSLGGGAPGYEAGPPALVSAGGGASPPALSRPPVLSSNGVVGKIEDVAAGVQKMEFRDHDPDVDLPERPGYAKDGCKIPIVTNFIKVKFSETDVYQYHITYDPPVDSKFLRHKLLEPCLADNRAWRFDGAILYTSEQLPTSPGSFTSVKENTGENITLKYILTKTISIEKCIPLLNIIFRTVLSKLKYTRLGKNLYDPKRAVQIPQHKLELWPGYVTSVSQLDGGFMLQTNVSHKMLRTDTVMDMLLEIYKSNPKNLQSVAVKEIVGHVVMTRYNNQTYRVDDIVWEENPRSCFEDRRGNKISYIQYYRDQYSIVIKDCSQPLLLHRMKPKRGQPQQEERLIYLIPELCAMTGLSQSTYDDFMVRKDIVAHTRLDPRDRIKALKGFIANVRESEEAKKELKRWDLHIDDETLKVEARKLEPEHILMGGHVNLSRHLVGERADFSQATTVNQPITPVNLDNWLLIFSQRDQPRARDLTTCMMEGARKLGMRVTAPVTLPLRDDRTETYVRAITSNLSDDVQLVVTIVPTDRDDRYNAIKQLCYIDTPVASQVIKSKTLSQPQKLRSVVQKIMLQINAKLGGELWATNIPMNNAMIIGIDTYHDPTSRAGFSFTGFVASMNRANTQFFSTSRKEDRGQEFSSSLQNMMTAALKMYQEKNNMLPDRIIIFRDGVSEGQFAVVKQYEIEQFEAAFEHLEGGYKPEMITVVVQKRIRTRMFYSEGDGHRGKIMNAPPGTVLDHTVTSDTLYDFYLVSQHVGKGTVTPSHYVVVHNTTTLKPDHIQKLAYKLTHMYWNWPGTVRVPSVCLYAHKIAYMHGQHLHRPAAAVLQDRLFYL